MRGFWNSSAAACIDGPMARLPTTASSKPAIGSRRVPYASLPPLARHGLTDVIPGRIDIAIPRSRRIPALQSPASIHVFAKDTFNLGRGVIRVGDDLTLGLYSAERSLIDVVRLRYREGAEIAWEAHCAAGFDERERGRMGLRITLPDLSMLGCGSQPEWYPGPPAGGRCCRGD
jgi:hypothetical protein